MVRLIYKKRRVSLTESSLSKSIQNVNNQKSDHQTNKDVDVQSNAHSKRVFAKQNEMYLITSQSATSPCSSLEALISDTIHGLINKILPKELILRVFSYLDITSLCRSAQVCHCWNKLAMDGSNWQNVDLFYFQKDIKAAVVENLAKRCGGFLKVLSLKGCENVQDSAMKTFAAKCHNIEKLSLSKCKLITDATSEFIGQHCHRLLELDLENCTAITDLTLKFIGKGCKQLRELNISWCQNITDRGITFLFKNCSNLTSLICKKCDGLSSYCFSYLTKKDLGQLKRLNLLSCLHVSDNTVEHIAKNCTQLQYLCLSNCREITDGAMQAIASHCPNIKDLELASCSNLSDTAFITLAKNCHDLERLDLEDCSLITDHTIFCLKNGCPNLSSLVLSHCENLTDNGLIALCASHKECLRVLELDNCPNITDNALDSMRTLKRLERVDLYDCQMITKEGIRKFKRLRPEVNVHAYFAPVALPVVQPPQRIGICRCCVII